MKIILNNAKQKGRKDSKLKINLEGGGEPRSLVLRRSLVDGLNPWFAAPVAISCRISVPNKHRFSASFSGVSF